MKRQRRSIAWFALLAVCFAQLASAAYACPLIQQALQGAVAEATATPPCAEMDAMVDQGMDAMCLEHCKAGKQLVDNHSPSPVLDVAPVLPALVQAFVDEFAPPRRVPDPPAFRATAPPVFASSSRLRI